MSKDTTALVLTDPQNDFLSPDGVAWELVSESVEEHDTVEHIGQLIDAAKQSGHLVAVSPHYYYPFDHQWKFGGTLEEKMHEIGMFDRRGPLVVDDVSGSGADFLAQYKDQLQDGETVITSPHKVYGPQNNDLVLQLRKRGISRVLLAGMSANLCVESHLATSSSRASRWRSSGMPPPPRSTPSWVTATPRRSSTSATSPRA